MSPAGSAAPDASTALISTPGSAPDGRDRRSRLVTMTASGRKVWTQDALPRIHEYYEGALDEFSMGDLSHTLHYLLKLLENMQRLDDAAPRGEDE